VREPLDVVVVGGGVVGCAVAWRLARTAARVAVVEAAHDVGEGASKGNSGIAASGYDCTPGTLEARLVLDSAPGWEQLCARLDTPFRRIGALAVALDDDELGRLPQLRAEAAANGVAAEILSGEAARAREPLLGSEGRGALLVPGEGVIDPIRLVLGYAELAARNGVEFHLSSPVTGIARDGDLLALTTPRGVLRSRFVVNAAGVAGGRLARAAGGEEFETWPRKGQFWLLDREIGARFGHIVGSVPTAHTRGVFAIPTTNGSLLLGPTAEDHADPGDRRVDAETLERVLAHARRLVPSLRREHAIKTFAANRPAGDPTYPVEHDPRVRGLVHAAAIRSTGVSSSPALAERVRELLAEAGAPVTVERPDALDALPPLPRLLGHPDPDALFAADARYGQVVCACEQVSAAEIAAAFAARLPPRSLDGLRKRTRAAGGRCQGAVCLAGVSFLCSAHGGLAPWEVAQGEPEATVGVGPAR
jgi:glycerol-3-phosphate dehydrogenase